MELVSKLDKLRSEYGRAATALEYAQKHYGAVAQEHRLREYESARTRWRVRA